MPTFKISHIKDHGVNVIIIPLAPVFGELDHDEKVRVIGLLEEAAIAAQLRGKVVPMWKEAAGYKFIAPYEWQDYFKKAFKWKHMMKNLNRELTCDLVDQCGLNPNFELSRAAQGLGPDGLVGVLLACWDFVARKLKRG